MAIVDKITGENIERFRGIIDFYMYKCVLPVARKWPTAPKPPYTALQAESMAAFALANVSLQRLSPKMLAEWQKGTTGVRPSWTDVFRGLVMKYWKIHRSIPPIALNYTINKTATTYQVVWNILQVYLDPLISEELYDRQTNIISITDFENVVGPLYFTLLDDDNTRLVAPYILLEI